MRSGGYFLNSPWVIASVTTICSMMGLLIAAWLTGDAGARDVQPRMHPLLYTTPVGESTYLKGRFLAAFLLNLLILVAVPVGLVLAALVPRAEAELIGPFQPTAYIGRYVFLAPAERVRGHGAPVLALGARPAGDRRIYSLGRPLQPGESLRLTARQAESGSWQVTLGVQARKVAVDSVGKETEVPMDDLVELGVFAASKDGEAGEPLYLRMHRVRSGEQQITVTVPRKPARAGIDPRSLLIDVDAADNFKKMR